MDDRNESMQAGGGQMREGERGSAPMKGREPLAARVLKGFIWLQAGFRRRLHAACCNERGQGTVEYAILVGVLVVIAIIAVAAFRGRLQELWTSIVEGINAL